MAARDFQLDLDAAARRLSRVYPSGAADANPSAAEDLPYRQIILQARTALVFVGAASDVTSTNYGFRLEIAAIGEGDSTVSIGPFETGPVKLSQIWAAGAGATIHIFGIPF